MMNLIITLHIIICALLIIIILIQRGRGGGLAESFSDVESMFGTKTNAFLTRTTSVLSILFFVTCLSLAILSVKQSRSLMRGIKMENQTTEALPSGEKESPGELPGQPAQPQAPQEPASQGLPKQEEAPQGETR